MPCPYCIKNCYTHEIHCSEDLIAIVDKLHSYMKDEIIKEVFSENTEKNDHFDLVYMATNRCHDDFVFNQFICNYCSQRFTLSVETYHGSGGAFRPDDEGMNFAAPSNRKQISIIYAGLHILSAIKGITYAYGFLKHLSLFPMLSSLFCLSFLIFYVCGYMIYVFSQVIDSIYFKFIIRLSIPHRNT